LAASLATALAPASTPEQSLHHIDLLSRGRRTFPVQPAASHLLFFLQILPDLIDALANHIQLLFQPARFLVEPGQILFRRWRRVITCPLPAGKTGGIVAMAPTSSTTAKAASVGKAETVARICISRHVLTGTVASAASGHWTGTHWARSITTRHVSHLLSLREFE
jgi:hypothetical protein